MLSEIDSKKNPILKTLDNESVALLGVIIGSISGLFFSSPRFDREFELERTKRISLFTLISKLSIGLSILSMIGTKDTDLKNFIAGGGVGLISSGAMDFVMLLGGD